MGKDKLAGGGSLARWLTYLIYMGRQVLGEGEGRSLTHSGLAYIMRGLDLHPLLEGFRLTQEAFLGQ